MGSFRLFGSFYDTVRTGTSGGVFRDGVLYFLGGTGGSGVLGAYRLPSGGGSALQITSATLPVYSTLTFWRGKYWVFGGYTSGWANVSSIYSGYNLSNMSVVGSLPANVAWGSVFIYNDVAYVVGGIVGGVFTYSAQMYRSYDGINWTTHTTSGFTGRMASAFFVWKDRMWILGGSGAAGVCTDVLSSVDGITWTTHPKLSPIPHAYGHTMGWCVFDDRIIIAGGDNTGGATVLYGNYHEGTEDGGWGPAIPLPYPTGTTFGGGLIMGTVENPELGFVGGGLRDNVNTPNPNILVYTNYKASVLRNLNGRVSLSGERRSS